jgi:hypothetical protein
MPITFFTPIPPTPTNECEACGFETELTEYPRRGYDPAKHSANEATKQICALCAGTLCGGVADLDFVRHQEHADVLRAISYVGNVILRELAKRGAQQ